MRTPANRDRDDEARDERDSGDDVPVEMASWAGATDAVRRRWLQRGIVPSDYPGPVAADWPELVAIVEERVKPERMKNNGIVAVTRRPLSTGFPQIDLHRPPSDNPSYAHHSRSILCRVAAEYNSQ